MAEVQVHTYKLIWYSTLTPPFLFSSYRLLCTTKAINDIDGSLLMKKSQELHKCQFCSNNQGKSSLLLNRPIFNWLFSVILCQGKMEILKTQYFSVLIKHESLSSSYSSLYTQWLLSFHHWLLVSRSYISIFSGSWIKASMFILRKYLSCYCLVMQSTILIQLWKEDSLNTWQQSYSQRRP